MLLGVMSDSHDNMENVVKALNIFRERGVNYIVHLGDIVSPFIARKMVELKWGNLYVSAVYGNNDGDKILLRKIFEKAGWKIDYGPRIEEISGRRIFLMHGYNGIEFTKKIAYSIAREKDIDLVLYGHTHQKDQISINDTLVVNPGEVYGSLYGEASIAIIDLEKLRVEFISI